MKLRSIYSIETAALAITLLIAAPVAKSENYQLTTSQPILTKDGPYSRLLESSVATYSKLRSGEYRSSFIEAEKSAVCVIVFPRVISGALVAGASHGDGVVTCKTPQGWSGISFVDLNGASIGAQIGGQVTEAIVFLNDKNSAVELAEGKFNFASTMQAAAGETRAMMKADAEPSKRATIISANKGLFAGVNLSGMHVAIDQDETRAFYKEPYSMKQILTTYQYSNPPGELVSFYKILPN